MRICFFGSEPNQVTSAGRGGSLPRKQQSRLHKPVKDRPLSSPCRPEPGALASWPSPTLQLIPGSQARPQGIHPLLYREPSGFLPLLPGTVPCASVSSAIIQQRSLSTKSPGARKCMGEQSSPLARVCWLTRDIRSSATLSCRLGILHLVPGPSHLVHRFPTLINLSFAILSHPHPNTHFPHPDSRLSFSPYIKALACPQEAIGSLHLQPPSFGLLTRTYTP
jgi:hypothetical protein